MLGDGRHGERQAGPQQQPVRVLGENLREDENGEQFLRQCLCGATDAWVDHFATFPSELVRRCILAGAAERVCSECGMPWARVVEKGELREHPAREGRQVRNVADFDGEDYAVRDNTLGLIREMQTVGFRATCSHKEVEPIGALVLDPFAGTATTLIQALKMGRRAIGIELSAKYVALARRRMDTEVGITEAEYLEQPRDMATQGRML